jgi:hypothetical protein
MYDKHLTVPQSLFTHSQFKVLTTINWWSKLFAGTNYHKDADHDNESNRYSVPKFYRDGKTSSSLRRHSPSVDARPLAAAALALRPVTAANIIRPCKACQIFGPDVGFNQGP